MYLIMSFDCFKIMFDILYAFSIDFKVIIIQNLKERCVFKLHSIILLQFINGIPKMKRISPRFVKKYCLKYNYNQLNFS